MQTVTIAGPYIVAGQLSWLWAINERHNISVKLLLAAWQSTYHHDRCFQNELTVPRRYLRKLVLFIRVIKFPTL